MNVSPNHAPRWQCSPRPAVAAGMAGWLMFMAVLASAAAPAFRDAVRISDGTGVAHLSRSSRGQLAWAEPGKLALVYAEHQASANISREITLSGRIMLREWTNNKGWGTPTQLNPGSNAGAAQPALLRWGGGNLFAVWQDYRHCTAAKNMMDNVEIYGAWRWSPYTPWEAPQRITASAAGGNGDNGFLPKIAQTANARVALAWFDFHWGETLDPVMNYPASEVAVKFSSALGQFDAAMNALTRTGAADRKSGDEGMNFTAPDIAVDGNGTFNLVWSSGIANPESSNIYFGTMNSSGSWLSKDRIRQGAGGQIDPPKLYADPGGDIWLLYTDGAAFGNPEVMLQRKAKNGGWDAPVRLTSNTGEQHYADAAIDPSGKIHVALLSGPVTNNKIQYLVYDPATRAITDQVTLASGAIGDDADLFSRVAIATDDQGHAYLVWNSSGQLWFTTDAPAPPVDAARDWKFYE